MNLLLDARKKVELALDQTGVHKAVEPQLSDALHTRSTAASPSLRDDPVAAGKNLFTAKSAPARPGMRLGIIPIALIGGAVIAAAGGYYVWREIQPPPQAARNLPKPPPPAPIASPVPPPPTAVAPLPTPPTPAQEAVATAPPVMAAGTPAPAAGIVQSSPTPPILRKAEAEAQHLRQQRGTVSPQPAQKSEAETGEALPASPAQAIRIERGQQPASTVDPALLAAWQAYRNGDLRAAWQRYGDVLRQDAKNRDALLGMAAIAQQQSQDDTALLYYRQALALDPRDPIAHAGMASLLGPGNGTGMESRLKQLLAQQPGSSALHFALGNLYAEQSRWGEAQQSYFAASNLEPDNAQFAFNLAVSLDHLGKNGLAAQHYRRALQLDGATAAPRIDRTQTQQRLNELTAAP